MKNVAFIGIGAVGSIYAQSMIQNPKDVNVWGIVSDRLPYLLDPVTINGELLAIQLKTPDDNAIKADLIIIAVKWQSLSEAIIEAAAFMQRETQVMSLLNGIRSEEILSSHFGWDNVLYTIGSGIDSSRTGHCITMNRRGRILFGEKRNDNPSSRVLAVRKLFEDTFIPYHVPIDMEKELWWKLMVNVGINQVSALLGLPYGAFRKDGHAMTTMRSAQVEVIRIAQAKGINLCMNDIYLWEEQLQSLSEYGQSSTLQDINNGRETEVEIFGGDICRMGRELGIPTPVNEDLYKQIRKLEKNRV